MLRSRVAGLLRQTAPVPAATVGPVDAVLVSHAHRDHLDLPSLRALRPPLIVAPRGAADVLRAARVAAVREVAPGDRLELGGIPVLVTEAVHDGRRDPWTRVPGTPVGYVLELPQRVYFPGDTAIFDAMAALRPLDLALLPIWGWGPALGPGHMDPEEAAEAAALLAPRVVVPIHWGTYYPAGLRRVRPLPLLEPPRRFAAALERDGGAGALQLLRPGGSLTLAEG